MSISNGQNGSDTTNRPHIDYTDKDYDSLREAMLALATQKLPEWKDLSANDPGVVLLELFAYMGDLMLYYQDRIANESFLDTAVERRSVMNLLRLIGYELRPPQPATVDFTLLFKPEATGKITIETETEFTAKANPNSSPIKFRYVQPSLELDLGALDTMQFEFEPYRYKKLSATQVDTMVQETIGSSDGSPGQRFKLSQSPLIDKSLKILVNGKLWQRQDTLLYSNAFGEHYVVRRDEADTAWIEFGDNTFGQIPPKGQNNITAIYYVGGGPKGNVPANSIVEMGEIAVKSNDQKPLKIINEKAASGGVDQESIAEAVLRGPQMFRARSRAVTAEDYEAYALEFGVAKVRAQAPGWNKVELYVAPTGGGYPSDTLKEDLRLFFEDKKMLTTIVEVKEPTYVNVIIEGDLYYKPTYLPDQVQQRVQDAVCRLLAFENVDFGYVLYKSEVYKVIEDIDGVAGVTITRFDRELPLPARLVADSDQGVLYFDWNEIPQAGYSYGIELKQPIKPGTGGRRGS